MFKKGKLVFALFLFTCLFLSMSFASADNLTDIDDSNNETIVDNHPTKSFTDLNEKINDLNQTEIILEDDYINHGECDKNFTEGIYINRSVTIDGQGHVIDANKSSRIFYINTNNITLKNITFKNGCGAIFCNASNITVNNCMFINNWEFSTGGAIYCEDSNTNIINSTFRDNGSNFPGGAISCMGLNTNIINSTFIRNNAYGLGGGSAVSLSNGFIIGSTFINNYQTEMDTTFYYYDMIINVVNESISYSDNCKKVWDVVRSYNVTIINSTFRNTPAHEIHYNRTVILIIGNDTNATNPYNNKYSDDVGNVAPVSTYKSSSIIFAKNKVFKKKLKTKLYSVVLKSKKGNVLKSTWITLKIKGKLFKAKTNSKGKATFKITKFYKKGNFKAVVKFKGSKKYKSVSKKVNIKIK